jgi:hypothetical protein
MKFKPGVRTVLKRTSRFSKKQVADRLDSILDTYRYSEAEDVYHIEVELRHMVGYLEDYVKELRK